MIPGFIFGGDATAKTPQELARQREIIHALMTSQRAPRNVGEGLSSLGNGIAAAILGSRADRGAAAGRESANEAFSPIAAALGGAAGDFPARPSAPGATDYPSQRVSQAAGNPGADAIRAGLIERGLPAHVADAFVMNFKDESGLDPGVNEKAPVVPGSRGGFGLAQWTGPRRDALEAFAAQRGVPASDADAQLDFLMNELQGPEANAAKAIMSAPDKNAAAAAIVNKFLRPAEQNRAAREARYLSAPTQVASLDQSIGLPAPQAAHGGQPLPPSQIPVPAQGFGQMQAPMAGNVPQQPVAPQVAQALTQPQGRNPMSGNSDAPSLGMLMQAAGNPWANKNQSEIVQALIGQRMKDSDPMTALQREKAQLEIENLRNPQAKPPEIETLFDETTGQEYKAKWNPQTQQFERVGGLKADKGGLSVTTNPDGTVSVTQGVGRPLTEGQSKDTVFATRAEGTLPIIDKYGDALTSLPESVGGSVPVVGNYAKSKDYQLAEQAGKEFLQAILRKDTGAAITPAETSEYGSVYLPRPGDTPELLAQKRVSRMRALEAIKAGMPPAAILAQERALMNVDQVKKPTVIDGYTIEEVE